MTQPLNPQLPHPQEPRHISARIPEKVAKGIVATGFMSFVGPNEVVIDFLQIIARPAHLASRVVMTPVVAEQFLAVLRENLSRYTASFGQPPALPKNPEAQPRTPQEIYDELKIPDEQLPGVYANACLVGHTPAEFAIDFITTFMPHAVVSSRVYLAAPRVPPLIDTLSNVLEKYHRQRQQQMPPPPFSPGNPPGSPPGREPPPNYGNAPGIPGFPTPPQN
ncbi:MAG: DUF3467 domain-containing protein [Phycisphaerales bacterium]|nr:DUF3467 domain-containing protein [Phycisphaerales bacterium]